ncbi:MAG: hypothetical protein F6K11_16380 [Leptolyngbya sp. SIO3F4]|nr:hypothetical protein [Leptolyngbya sp. SIO3F4]
MAKASQPSILRGLRSHELFKNSTTSAIVLNPYTCRSAPRQLLEHYILAQLGHESPTGVMARPIVSKHMSKRIVGYARVSKQSEPFQSM